MKSHGAVTISDFQSFKVKKQNTFQLPFKASQT